MDLFKGQVTPMVLNAYKESNIVIVLVPDIAVLKAKYSADTQQVCDAGSDSEQENGDEIDFERNAFVAFYDEPDL